MRILLNLLLLTTSLCTIAQGPTANWINAWGGPDNDFVIDVANDEAGNIYAVGYFQATVDFDPGPGVYNLTSAGGFDIYITKYDQLGNFIWALRFGSANITLGSNNDFGSSIAVTGSGDIVIAGSFRGTVDFDPGPGVFNLTATGFASSPLILKLDSNGNFIWAVSLNGSGSAKQIDVDPDDNILVAGSYGNTIDFDPGASIFNLTSAGNDDTFVLKLNTNANFVWARSFGTIGSEGLDALSIDVMGNVYVFGTFSGSGDFDPGTGVFTLTSAGGTDYYAVKLGATGNFDWGFSLGGTDSVSVDSGSLMISQDGFLIIVGRFRAPTDFDPGVGMFILNDSGAPNTFVLKLDLNANLIWVKQFTGSNNGERLISWVDGGVLVVGNFNNSMDADPGADEFLLTETGSTDVYFVQLDQDGNMEWAAAYGTSALDIKVLHRVSESEILIGGVAAGGTVYLTYDLDPGPNVFTYTSAGSGSNDSFLVSLAVPGCEPTSIELTVEACNELTSPSGNYVWTTSGIYTDTLTNAAGCDSVLVFNLTILENHPPIHVPIDTLYVNCFENIPDTYPQFTDPDGDVLDTVCVESLITGVCGYTLTRSCIATDSCGATAEGQVVIVSGDFTAPVFDNTSFIQINPCGEWDPAEYISASDNCDTSVVIILENMIPLSGGCNTWWLADLVATDQCGNTAMHELLVEMTDEVGPNILNVPPDEEIECGEMLPPPPSNVIAIDACGTVNELEYSEIQQDDGCTTSFVRSWVAMDNCGHTTTASYTISFVDNTPPVLSASPEDTLISCGTTPPVPPLVIAEDQCDGTLIVQFEEIQIPAQEFDNGSYADCTLQTPATMDSPWALILFDMLGEQTYYTVEEGAIHVDQSGNTMTAQILATLVSSTNSHAGFFLTLNLTDGVDWDTWSNMPFPTDYKDDANLSGDAYLDWYYFIIESSSNLVGWGDFDGSFINLEHAPSSYYYAYQLGLAANNTSLDFGSGGWVYYTGTLVDSSQGTSTEVDAAGDLSFVHLCCGEPSYERIWTAQDCAGNVVTHTQNIGYSSGNTMTALVLPKNPEFQISTLFPNPTMGEFEIKVETDITGQYELSLSSLYFFHHTVLFRGKLLAGQVENFNVALPLSDGIYAVRLRNLDSGLADQCIVIVE